MRIYEPDFFTPSEHGAVAMGRWLLLRARNTGRALVIVGEALGWHIHLLRRRQEVGHQLYLCGIKSLGVTSVVALFTGMILALQAGLILREWGQEAMVGRLVSQTMVREMGPMMTALILAASVGAAMAAEIGTMTVSEEISALHVMSVNPASYLVMPRLFAFMVMCPVLTIYTNVIGVVGGMLVAKTQLGLPCQAYYDDVMAYLGNKEIYVGLLKSWIFAVIVVTVACYEGLSTTNGAVGVGRATRVTVVRSFLLVLIFGYITTRLFY